MNVAQRTAKVRQSRFVSQILQINPPKAKDIQRNILDLGVKQFCNELSKQCPVQM